MSLTTKEEDTLNRLSDCHMWMENRYTMENKLLYLLLKEIQESRKETKRTNELLLEMKESLASTQQEVVKLTKTLTPLNRDGNYYAMNVRKT
jgi:hypothetical protein